LHQTRADIFSLFDNICLLAKGGFPVYDGPAEHMLQHFKECGYECPNDINPADFVLDTMSVDLQSSEVELRSRARVTALITDSRKIMLTKPCQPIQAGNMSDLKHQEASFAHALPIISRRSWLNTRRQPLLMLSRALQTLSLAVILLLFFTPLAGDQIGYRNRLGLLQQITALLFVGMLNNIAVYPLERNSFDNEYADGAYGISAFFFSYLLGEIPFQLFTALGYSLIIQYSTGLDRTAADMFIMTYCVFCIQNAGESTGIIFNTLLTRSTGLAQLAISTLMSITAVTAGKITLLLMFVLVSLTDPLLQVL